MKPTENAVAAARWAGHPLTGGQLDRLEAFASWLWAEAIPAGGLGPREGARLWPRHIADSLTFAVGWEEPPPDLLDVGTGAGLPGVPLAVLWPGTAVCLLDRGGRRVRLLQRLSRILELDNVEVRHEDVDRVRSRWHGLTTRGAVPLGATPHHAARLLHPGGVAVVGLSRRATPPPAVWGVEKEAQRRGLRTEVVDVPLTILDGAAWLFIMARCSADSEADR